MGTFQGMTDEERAAMRAEHLNVITLDLICSVLPANIVTDKLFEPDGHLLDDYGMDVLDAHGIADAVSSKWKVSVDGDALNERAPQPTTGVVIITVADIAKHVQADQLAQHKAWIADQLSAAKRRKATIEATPGKYGPEVLRMVERQIARHTEEAAYA